MLSILIPTYNYECYQLVAELQQQAGALNIPFEIIVADDASREEMKIANRKINELPHCRYIELEENIGRARIRNYLGEQAIHAYLLFLDSDVRVCFDNFVSLYIRNIDGNTVICGSTRFKRRVPAPNMTLRYTYGVKREEKSAEVCNRTPYAQFTSISFLIEKNTFMSIRFNDCFTKYGHEDTLLGKELELAGVPIRHIDNPIFHNVPDTNEMFLRKTHSSIENTIRYKDLLSSHVRVLQIYNQIKKSGLHHPLALLFRIVQQPIRRNLVGRHPSMKLFAFYKLGYLCMLENRLSKK